MALFSPLVTQQVICFSLVWLAYASTYLLRKPLGVIKTDLGQHLGVGKALLGWCDTALVLPYASVQILWPSLADSHGPRRVLSLCLALAALATLATYRAQSLVTRVHVKETYKYQFLIWPFDMLMGTQILGKFFFEKNFNNILMFIYRHKDFSCSCFLSLFYRYQHCKVTADKQADHNHLIR